MRIILTAAALVSAFALGGCARQMLQGAQNDCSAFGFTPGTVEYANCVQQSFANRQQRMAAMGAAMSSAGRQMTPAPAYSAQGTAYLRSQEVRGTSRICVYDRMGSPYVMTIGAAQVCPISQ